MSIDIIGIEAPLNKIERIAAALNLIAQVPDMEELTQSAIYGLAETLAEQHSIAMDMLYPNRGESQ